MEYVIVGGILLFLIIIWDKIKKKNQEEKKALEAKEKAEKERERLKKEQEEKKKIIQEQSQIFQSKVKKEEEKRSQEEYEKIIIAHKISEYIIIGKRDKDNTYCFLKYDYNSKNKSLNIGKKIEIKVEKINSWNWFNEERYVYYVDNGLKENFYDIISFLQEKNVTKFYHFTDKRNLKNIEEMGGLYSWDYLLKSNKKDNVIFGSNELSRNLDIRYKLQNNVRLSFCKEHPMKFVAERDGRIQNPIVLEIDISVAMLKNTLFSDRNATDNNHKKGGKLEDLKNIKFDVFQKNYFELDDLYKKYYQAEVLVEKFIPLKFITNFNDIMQK